MDLKKIAYSFSYDDPCSLGPRPTNAPQSPSSAAAPQPFQTPPPSAMGHPPLSPPGQQPPSMGSPPPMGMAGPPGPGVPLGGGVHQQALGPQSYPQQPGKIEGFASTQFTFD